MQKAGKDMQTLQRVLFQLAGETPGLSISGRLERQHFLPTDRLG